MNFEVASITSPERDVPTHLGDMAQAFPALPALNAALATSLWLYDPVAGETRYQPPGVPNIPWYQWAETLREVARHERPQLIEEEDPLAVLALPLPSSGAESLVAIGVFPTRVVHQLADVERAAKVLQVDAEALWDWTLRQAVTNTSTLERLAMLALSKIHSDRRVRLLEGEVEALSAKIGSTYEEISLIYRLTQNLKLSGSREALAEMTLDWLHEVLPAEGLVLQFLNTEETLPSDETAEPLLARYGLCPLTDDEFNDLVGDLELDATHRPIVINPASLPLRWRFPNVQQLVLVPIAEGNRVFGWIAAFNHNQGEEFGTAEASLLSSIGTLLGIHASNVELYRQQAHMLADVVRAMSSAIDAKDPYTRGHSDRVARVAVRLAQQLGCDNETAKTIYLSGLLHDIGKIGIDDNVLRKPGKLTDAEFEHIKTHVQIGYKILKDLRKMQHMLPVVLHHHEAWDGSGYPHGLKGEQIPYWARIVAVADAYDAMASDRPYRQGMPEAKIDEIMRRGAGQQWDEKVVAAFFNCRDDIREISQHDVDHNELAALQWT